VAMLIFAPNAIDPGHFEDCARKMYPHYNHLNVSTWIIGPALGEEPLSSAERAKSVASAGADPTVATCAIQFAHRSVCYEALPLALLSFLAKHSSRWTRSRGSRSENSRWTSRHCRHLVTRRAGPICPQHGRGEGGVSLRPKGP